MPKAIKNLKHKQALLRKRNAEETLSNVSLSLKDPLYSIGIILEHLVLSQLNFCLLQSLRNLNEQYLGFDINIFVQNFLMDKNKILAPIFHIKDLYNWRDPIISTSISTTLDALSTKSNNIYYYVYDMNFLNNFEIQNDILENVFNNDRVNIITRSESYKDILKEEFNKKIIEKTCLDLDIIEMGKIIFEREKNGAFKNE